MHVLVHDCVQLQVQARLRNPFGCTILFTKLEMAITYQGVQVGRGDTEIPIKLGPYEQDWSARVSGSALAGVVLGSCSGTQRCMES